MATTKYDPSYHPAAAREACAVKGLIDTELAEYFGITSATLYNWQNKYPEFKRAMQEGKSRANELVEGALFKKAIGYTYTHDEITKEIDFKTNKMKITKRVTKTVHVPADSTSIIFFLKNRDPERWRDAKDVNINTHEAALAELDDD